MSRVIAVENNLHPVCDYLSAQGCEIIAVERAQDTRVNAVVVSGADKNLLGMQDVQTQAPVIDARGRTPEDIWQEIQRRGLV